ncbi:MAG: ABC transporter permease subunit [Nesterenkonia sp.]|uniref:ABC transporter permease n=1 Tax=Nesterenkonia marinintestina TaxID=2979865 RepID=UPI0021C00E3D|nr:ABC transporter permease subunit [Nesterenkonia sp. GX14115]MDO5492597.1 ABC transporter permease subunit [Nesterenkonia sp.]
MVEILDWVRWGLNHSDRVLMLTFEHLRLSLPAILASLLVSVPIAAAANRLRPLREVIVSGTGLLYAMPSLPLFIVLPIILGTGVRDMINVVVALTLFGISLMVRSAADGLAAVPEHIRLSATAQGFSPWRRFIGVDLPLAGPAMLAGLRVVSVSTISLVSVSAVLGVQSLGSLFTDGFQRSIVASIVIGILATALLALLMDLLLVLLGRLLMPWTQTARTSAGPVGRGRGR